MNQQEKISDKSDSLIGLLAAQCADLERLLSLARREAEEVGRGNFEAVLEIVSERAKIGERLETYGRQTAELREFLNASQFSSEAIMTRIIGFASLTLEQDCETKKLLEAARDETAGDLKNLEKGKNGISLYRHEATKGLTYSCSV